MIFLGIGSNLQSSFGNRFKNINLAISLIEKNNIKLIKKSSYYESTSFPNVNDPMFINIVIEVSTSLKPIDLMKILLKIEQSLERERKNKNDPRTCDIDIIDYKNESMNLKLEKIQLKIPHISMTERDFVLLPLKEICPHWSHPSTKEPIDNLINNLKNKNNNITKLSQSDIIKYVE